jgi:hypothetical protein
MKINNRLSNDFKDEFGVRQGDPLSATLFSVAIDSNLKQTSEVTSPPDLNNVSHMLTIF